MKTTLVATVLNEAGTIDAFLNSIKNQTEYPSEVIVVDGGSTDNTLEKIKTILPSAKIIRKKGNRSVGRNTGIRDSKNSIILCSDAGCVLDKDWVKNLIKPFSEHSIDVVSGFYHPVAHSTFEKCLSTYTCVMEEKLTDDFLPSSRSIAFRKSAWEQIGGYPEHLNTCEDLVFAKKLKEQGFVFYLQKKAFVMWSQRKNLVEAWNQFFNYSFGDGKARYFRPQTPFLFIRYFIAFLFFYCYVITKYTPFLYSLLLGCVLYILWAIYKNYRYVKRPGAFYILPALQFTSDAAVLLGTSLGFIQSFM